MFSKLSSKHFRNFAEKLPAISPNSQADNLEFFFRIKKKDKGRLMSVFELKRLPLNLSVALVELLNDALANEPIRRVKWNEIKLHQEFFLLKLFLQP